MSPYLPGLISESNCVLLTSPHNIQYFTGFTGGEGVAILGDTQNLLFTDSRYIEQARNEARGFIVEEVTNFIEAISKCAAEMNLNEIMIEDAEMSVSFHKELSRSVRGICLLPISPLLEHRRMIKTDFELEALAGAEKIACDAFEGILDMIKPGVSEADIALELEYRMRKLGGEAIAFDTIVLSGSKTSLPHGRPGNKKIESGDFVTMDFGCKVHGYCSDMTRTVVVGKASEEQKKIYNTVKTAQQTALDYICEGVWASDVDAIARRVIDDAGYGKFFGHSLGHGVGLLIHELPNLSSKSEVTLLEDMIVTCEPGIYIPGFGGVRIEDMVCVKRNGILNLTKTEKSLIEL